ncbi:dihydrodipicolinate reductase [Fertoebacter nigrum]|uniref:Dihydrodipicolinate reductase n=1 Tax=Fertoeibacter niger TaxID=2656921 RepID=A0A8X8H2K2_9RHOB|nr:dihydrodipicolinate reductase [Fertoeibacter niger]NUB46423.1 dihydrodipicolinate reductase [Fertoeibacter niger]
MIRTAVVVAICAGLAAPVAAEGLARVQDKSDFVGLVGGKALTRMGITLEVTPDGAITGSAFGKPVTGAWRWNAGLFCRDLYFGKQDLGPNCQVVQTDGATVRFISDEGEGDYADLRLK